MDALSDILRVVGLTGGVFVDAEFTEPWAVAGRVSPESCRPFMVQPQRVVCFHYVVEGGFTLALDGDFACRVEAGEAVMVPRNDLHVMGSAVGVPAIPAGELVRSHEGGLQKIEHGGGGPRSHLVCGFMGGNEQLEYLVSSLPPFLKIEVSSLPGGDWMRHTFTYAAHALSHSEPGTATVLARVAELLFVETIRGYLASLPPEETGWLSALRDPVIGRALSLLHTRLDDDWTAEALARELNMSRSAFADRFTSVVGQPPMRYLAHWRMQVARQKLMETGGSVAQIAFDVGYESEAAFARAFRREHGLPPASWRKRSTDAATGHA